MNQMLENQFREETGEKVSFGGIYTDFYVHWLEGKIGSMQNMIFHLNQELEAKNEQTP